jgi:hypothetical protein
MAIPPEFPPSLAFEESEPPSPPWPTAPEFAEPCDPVGGGELASIGAGFFPPQPGSKNNAAMQPTSEKALNMISVSGQQANLLRHNKV